MSSDSAPKLLCAHSLIYRPTLQLFVVWWARKWVTGVWSYIWAHQENWSEDDQPYDPPDDSGEEGNAEDPGGRIKRRSIQGKKLQPSKSIKAAVCLKSYCHVNILTQRFENPIYLVEFVWISVWTGLQIPYGAKVRPREWRTDGWIETDRWSSCLYQNKRHNYSRGIEEVGAKTIPDGIRKRPQTDFDRAKVALALSAVPPSLPCRDR